MPSYNKVLLMGNLTRDPETRYTTGGSAVCTMGLACSRRYLTAQGEEREETCFVDVWGKQGESCQSYLHKGSPAFVEGRLRYDSWEDKATGQKRSRLRVQAERVQFLSAPARDRQFTDGGDASPGHGRPQGAPQGDPPPPRAAAPRRPAAPEPMPAVEMPPAEFSGSEPEPPPPPVDDIPF